MIKINITKITVAIVAGSIMLFGWQTASAQEYILFQVIEALDCSHTTYSSGLGEANDSECELFAPKLTGHEIKSDAWNSPILYGVYDSVHAYTDPITSVHSLNIEFADHEFVLGVDPGFSVDGNAWKLDLSQWNNAHSDGDRLMFLTGYIYSGKVNSVLQSNNSEVDGQETLSTSFTVRIVQQIIDDTDKGDNDSNPTDLETPSTGWLSMIRDNYAFRTSFVSGALGLSVLAILIMMLAHRKKRKA